MIKSLMTRAFGNWHTDLHWGKRSVISLVVFVVVHCSRVEVEERCILQHPRKFCAAQLQV